MTTLNTQTPLTLCRDCHQLTSQPSLYTQVDENYCPMYDFALCPSCDVKQDALERGVSLAEYLTVLVPADLATDLAKGMISQQEHDAWLAAYAQIAVAV